MNLKILDLLTIDMQNLMNQYIANCLVSKISSDISSKINPTIRLLYSREATVLSLNELVKLRRKTVFAPIARYSDGENQKNIILNRDRSSSMTTVKDEHTPNSDKEEILHQFQETNWDSNQELEYVKVPKSYENKVKSSKADLTFDNTNGELATRWDVVYKTILRDFRRFYLDSFKTLKCTILQNLDLTDSLMEFVKANFKGEPKSIQKITSIDLGCLLFPKEIIKDKSLFNYLVHWNHFEDRGKDIHASIMQIHGFLYKFSIDKIEECFKNKSMCRLFINYIKSGKDRVNSNMTMSKHLTVYTKARKILEEKANEGLSN